MVAICATCCAMGQRLDGALRETVGSRGGVALTDSVPEVVVTATGTEHVLKNVPVQTEVITQKELARYGGSSLGDILSGLTASFQFNEDDMGAHMQLNGLGNSYILILVDGKRIHGDVGGENDLGLIDPANVEKIEIVKGASSALYGSDAIAGVINIITKKHRAEGLTVENKTRVGSYGDLRQHNGVGLNWGRWSSWTNFQLQHSDGWQNTATEHTSSAETPVTDSRNKTRNRFTNWQVQERLDYRASDRLQLHAEGSVYGKRIYRPSGKYAHYDVHTYDLQYRNSGVGAGAKWRINETDLLTLDVDWNRHAYKYYFTSDDVVEDYNMDPTNFYYPYFPYLKGQTQLQSDQQRTLAQLRGTFSLAGSNRLVSGAEFRYDWLKAPSRVEGGTVDDHTEALYVQDEWNLWRPLNVTAGLRLNHNGQFGWRLTPKVSAMVKLGEAWRLRGQWSQGFKTPTLKELHYHYVRQMGNMYLNLGNTSLRPQRSNYFSLGGEYTCGGLSVSVTSYYNKVSDMISSVKIGRNEIPPQYLVQYAEMDLIAKRYENIDEAETYGVDVQARYQWGDWAAGLGYSYLDTQANTYDTDHDRMEEVTIDGMAHHKGNWYVTWGRQLRSLYRLDVGVYGRMSTKRYYQVDGDGKGYQLWKLATTHTFTPKTSALRYTVEAGVDNVLNYVDRTPHGLHLGTTTAGRTVYVSLNVQFQKGKTLRRASAKHYTQDEEE